MDRKIKAWMKANMEDYRDECGEINATQLAEAACDEFEGWDGNDIPEVYFELAGWIAAAYSPQAA